MGLDWLWIPMTTDWIDIGARWTIRLPHHCRGVCAVQAWESIPRLNTACKVARRVPDPSNRTPLPSGRLNSLNHIEGLKTLLIFSIDVERRVHPEFIGKKSIWSIRIIRHHE